MRCSATSPAYGSSTVACVHWRESGEDEANDVDDGGGIGEDGDGDADGEDSGAQRSTVARRVTSWVISVMTHGIALSSETPSAGARASNNWSIGTGRKTSCKVR